MLTERFCGIIGLKACLDECDHPNNGCDCARISGALMKLFKYEHSGLTPEEVAEMISPETVETVRLLSTMADEGSLQHMLELFQAEAQGRLIVLPCKVGDKVWVHDRDGRPREMILDAPDIQCHCAKEDDVCMALCDRKNTGVCAYRLKNDGSDIGTALFLAPEAAANTLKGGAK